MELDLDTLNKAIEKLPELDSKALRSEACAENMRNRWKDPAFQERCKKRSNAINWEELEPKFQVAIADPVMGTGKTRCFMKN